MRVNEPLIIAMMLLTSARLCYGETYTYWVDASCSNLPGWNDWIAEALSMARRSAERLADPTDTDYANVFKTIISTKKDDTTIYSRTNDFVKVHNGDTIFPVRDTAYNIVHSALGSVGSDWQFVTSEGGRLGSHTRFYCDNGAHFSTSSTKKGGFFIDPVNQIKSRYKCPNKVWAYASVGVLRIKDTDPQQNPYRSTITICDSVFKRSKKLGIYPRLADVPAKKDLTKSLKDGVSDFAGMISMTILHEILHTYPYYLSDIPDSKDAYGWYNIIRKIPADSVNNCDNLAYLSLWALLADRSPGGKNSQGGGHTLPRPWDNPDSAGGKQAKIDTQKGLLEAYKDITGKISSTKRMIKGFHA